ncbi:hypothetical protein BDV96DRAFT_642948 [Lophiotrema nucula]|uniref:Uncharacterized protein n=1 Tax=Lophiotrema nucula TaxID=690887 RepID=A0A6A5ZIV3_9PLEO|nr:hypothetical protein BDV96DRAFT_642948 [Lophiotrema nucula]
MNFFCKIEDTPHSSTGMTDEGRLLEDAYSDEDTGSETSTDSNNDVEILESTKAERDGKWEEWRDDEDEEVGRDDKPSTTPRIIARYIYPGERQLSYATGTGDREVALLNRLRGIFGRLALLVPFSLLQTPGGGNANHGGAHSDYQIAVFNMVSYSITENGDPLLVPVEIIAQHPRVRAIVKEYEMPLPVEDELGSEIRAALRKLRDC